MKKIFVGIVVLIAAYIGSSMYAANIAEKKVDQTVAGFAGYADVKHGKVSVDLLDLGVHISDVVVSPKGATQNIRIHEIVVHDLDEQANIPSFMKVSLHGIESDNLKQLFNANKQMKALGYNDNLLVNVDLEYHYNRDDKDLTFNTRMRADGVGDIRLTTRLGNLALSRNDIVRLPYTFQKVTFYNGEINYDDDSLVERMSKAGAKDKGISVDQFKDRARKDFEQKMNKTTDPAIRDALKSILNFITDPESISISMTPEKPVPLSRLMKTHNEHDLIKLLNVKIES